MKTSTGLFPLSVVARFLGKPDREMTSLIELDGLPAIKIPAKTKPQRKVPLAPLHAWLKDRSENLVMSVEDLRKELVRVSEEMAEQRLASEKGKVKSEKEEPVHA